MSDEDVQIIPIPSNFPFGFTYVLPGWARTSPAGQGAPPSKRRRTDDDPDLTMPRSKKSKKGGRGRGPKDWKITRVDLQVRYSACFLHNFNRHPASESVPPPRARFHEPSFSVYCPAPSLRRGNGPVRGTVLFRRRR